MYSASYLVTGNIYKAYEDVGMESQTYLENGAIGGLDKVVVLGAFIN